MSWSRTAAAILLALIVLICFFPALVTRDAPEQQFRSETDVAPSARFPLGTDELGRSRLARLLAGTGTSLMLAPAASLLSVFLASGAALIAASTGRSGNRMFELTADLMSSLPWLFVLIALRASLPLDTPAPISVAITFGVLAVLGWAGPARIIRNAGQAAAEQEFINQARALGVSEWRISTVHLLPNIWPVAMAQFWVNVPVFILAEANLGLLGMGVSEPYSSLGNQLRELESYTAVTGKPWLLAPAVLLTVIVAAMWTISRGRERPS